MTASTRQSSWAARRTSFRGRPRCGLRGLRESPSSRASSSAKDLSPRAVLRTAASKCRAARARPARRRRCCKPGRLSSAMACFDDALAHAPRAALRPAAFWSARGLSSSAMPTTVVWGLEPERCIGHAGGHAEVQVRGRGPPGKCADRPLLRPGRVDVAAGAEERWQSGPCLQGRGQGVRVLPQVHPRGSRSSKFVGFRHGGAVEHVHGGVPFSLGQEPGDVGVGLACTNHEDTGASWRQVAIL